MIRPKAGLLSDVWVYMGCNALEGYSFKKWSFFSLSLMAHHGQAFDPSDKCFAFLSFYRLGHPKNVRNDTHISYGGPGALGGLLTQF